MRFLMRARLSDKISAVNLVCMALLAGALLALYQFTLSSYGDHQAQKYQESAIRVAWDVLGQYGGAYRIDNGRLMAGDRPLNDFFEPVDRIKGLMGGTATVFMGDLRIATNVKKPDGTRAVGTRLAPGPVYDAVLKRGAPYRGKAEILGQTYFTAYDPIKDASGAVIGVLYVGVPEADFASELAASHRSAALLAMAIAAAFGAAMLFLSRRMFSPLRDLAETMARIGEGEFDAPAAHVGRADDIGQMARAVEVLRQAGLRKRELDADSARRRSEIEEQRRRHETSQTLSGEERNRALEQLGDVLGRIASGDLTAQLGEGFAPGYSRIRDDYNAAIKQLSGTLQVVDASAEAMHSGTRELAASSDELARRVREQAVSLEETASAVARISSTVQASTEGASRARSVVASAYSDAKQSAGVVREAIAAIHEIADSARSIGQTIGVIDEIAFQTNLLALNAGVEAARAGDAGRGFAVVAMEVRALAQRSATAAKEIKVLIATSTAKVENGVKLVSETGDSLERIIGEVNDINASVAMIAASAIEQAAGLKEIDAAVRRMDAFGQQSAVMAEKASEASQTLSREAEQMVELIGRFRLDPSPHGAGRSLAA